MPDLGAHGLENLTYKYLCNSSLCYFFVWFMFYLLLLWSTLIESSWQNRIQPIAFWYSDIVLATYPYLPTCAPFLFCNLHIDICNPTSSVYLIRYLQSCTTDMITYIISYLTFLYCVLSKSSVLLNTVGFPAGSWCSRGLTATGFPTVDIGPGINQFPCVCVHAHCTYRCKCVCIYIYIYIYLSLSLCIFQERKKARERERERGREKKN